MSQARRLFLCRHGRTAWNAEGRIQGLTDLPLDDVGQRQVEALAELLVGFKPASARLISSPMLRAQQSAAVLAKRLGLEIESDEALIEVNTGQYTGVSMAALRQDPAWRAQLKDPLLEGYGEGGEAHASVQARCQRALERYCRVAGGDVIFVSHACPLRHMLSILLDIPAQRHYHLAVPNASLSIFEVHSEFYKMLNVNLALPLVKEPV